MMDNNQNVRNQGGVQRGLQQHQNDRDRIDRQSVKLTKVTGRVRIIGNGETSIAITFPVTFTDRPAFSSGWELAENQVSVLVGGSLPTVVTGLAGWNRVEKVQGLYHYTGATLIVVTTNNPRYLFVHWHMEALAFQNPINNLATPDALT